MKKILALLLAAVLMTGCSAAEVNERVFVSAFFVEKVFGGYSVTIDYSLADGSQSRMSANAESVGKAVGEISSLLGKNVFTGHCRLLFVGDGIDNIYDGLMWFAEGERLSPDAVMCSADKKVLEADNLSYAYSVISLAAQRGLPDGRIIRVYSDMAEKTPTLVPYISLSGGFIEVTGGELISGGRFIGRLTEDESVGAAILMGRKVKTVFSDGKTHAEVELHASGRKLITDEETPSMRLEISVKGTSDSSFAQSREFIADELSERIFSASELASLSGEDFIGLEKLVKKQLPAKYDAVDKKKLLKECNFEAVVSFRLYEKSKY